MPNPCCYSEFANQEDIKRIPDQSINDYWQAEKLAHLRKQLLNGEKPKSCWWCWVDEENGMESKRTRDSHQLNSYTESLYGDITQESYTKLVDKIVTKNPKRKF